jgi:hypothetical protein
MSAFFYIAFAPLLAIFVQDLRSRAIWWFLPPVLFGCFIGMRWNALAPADVPLNCAFVLGLTGLLAIYVRLRFGKAGSALTAYFGLGDLLYLLAITPLFPFRGFVYFFTFGTIAVLVVHFAVQLFRKSTTIPYAGYFALFTGIILAAEHLFPELLLTLTSRYGQLG